MSKVLVVGCGGREHAIAYKFYKEGHDIYMIGINPAVEEFGVCVYLEEDKIPNYALENEIDLVFVGPETPLVNGLIDKLKEKNIKAFGPSKKAAQLEGSKVFSKMMMEKYNIPTAKYRSFNNYEEAKNYLSKQNMPVVLKADGLAAGKGVIISYSMEEAQHELREMMCNCKFNESGTSVVIEEFLQGEEFSLMCFVSDKKVYPMEIAQDHKRSFDNDKGLNTGGMGAYLPLRKITREDINQGVEQVVQPIVNAMSEEGMPFYGILYAGLMKCSDGVKTIEFNVRFGDPESEVILLKLESSLYDIATNIIDGKEIELKWNNDTIIGVVMAAKGYPEESPKGGVIKGLDKLSVPVFHMGTKKVNNNITINGGRVLLVCASGKNLIEARQKVYNEIQKIESDDLFFRTDIGHLSL
ncbi:phosphoribosylamine--glycine ligase [Gemella sp. GH3]|uniref:phosphoribosylamine--glycine ligase n=1 Tax=unclassified Gemella TaxID=2624949 RepID=UPI0015D0A38B|nr:MULTISPECIES: phosphoribosylamine--glycine ligase [unclassified Gemella]MBF0713772.1 phosphoribosylamine--glycine ligase [Gemella sp. GH3.1]NYS50724.1 phosphoribosylamine--glycine ligase [Gemella sp. GH3]